MEKDNTFAQWMGVIKGFWTTLNSSGISLCIQVKNHSNAHFATKDSHLISI
jgi:hypothetical protein